LTTFRHRVVHEPLLRLETVDGSRVNPCN
jgi:hypothetical protein